MQSFPLTVYGDVCNPGYMGPSDFVKEADRFDVLHGRKIPKRDPASDKTCFHSYEEGTNWRPKLDKRIGWHDYCGGRIYAIAISYYYNVIVCESCNLRIPVSSQIDTFGRLKKYFEKKVGDERVRMGKSRIPSQGRRPPGSKKKK